MSEKTVNLQIKGMHCGSCINHITTLLTRIGVIDVDIDIANAFARVRFDNDLAFADEIIETIQGAGYTTKKLSITDDVYNLLG